MVVCFYTTILEEEIIYEGLVKEPSTYVTLPDCLICCKQNRCRKAVSRCTARVTHSNPLLFHIKHRMWSLRPFSCSTSGNAFLYARSPSLQSRYRYREGKLTLDWDGLVVAPPPPPLPVEVEDGEIIEVTLTINVIALLSNQLGIASPQLLLQSMSWQPPRFFVTFSSQ